MKWLIKNARILSTSSPWDNQEVDLLLVDGVITQVGVALTDADARVFDAGGAYLSPGWMDIGCVHGDPGFEHREDLFSLAVAANAGGYTAIAPFPNTLPAADSQAQLHYLRQHKAHTRVEIFPIAALTEGIQGQAIAEMIDLHHAGAVAFSDGLKSVQHAGVMMRALEYVKQFDGLVINRPDEQFLSSEGQLHEGLESTLMGLPGIPPLAEELMLYRDLRLTDYARSRLMVYNVSTAGSVELIRKAKASGLQVFASVAALNLAFDSTRLITFDSNLKVLPPLRSPIDQEALIAGLQDGTIDCITSGHLPLEDDLKLREFPYTAFGAIGLETTFALVHTRLAAILGLRLLLDKLVGGPRGILGLTTPEIKAGVPVNFTIFDTEKTWVFAEKHIQSRSRNTPLLNHTLKGKVLATFFRQEAQINVD